MTSQADLFTDAPPVLFDACPSMAQARAQNRLAGAVDHIRTAVALIWDTDLQQFQLGPLSPVQVEDALRRLRQLDATLHALADHVEDQINAGQEPRKDG